MGKCIFGFLLTSVFALSVSAESKSPTCQKLEGLKKSCEEMQSSVDMDGPMALYSNLIEELNKSEKSCGEYAATERCAAKLNDRIAASKPARPYYKVHADVQLKTFGMDLIGSVTETPAGKPSKSRSPANTK